MKCTYFVIVEIFIGASNCPIVISYWCIMDIPPANYVYLKFWGLSQYKIKYNAVKNSISVVFFWPKTKSSLPPIVFISKIRSS